MSSYGSDFDNSAVSGVYPYRNEMLSDPAVNKCNDQTVIHHLLAQAFSEEVTMPDDWIVGQELK